MTLETRKIELAQKLLAIDDESILKEVQWILDRSSNIDPNLTSSIKTGIEQTNNREGVDHLDAKEIYKKWL